MKIESITGRTNPLFTYVRKLQTSKSFRDMQGRFVADGRKLLEDAMNSDATVRCVILSGSGQIPDVPEGVRIVMTSEELMKKISVMESPQGVLFVCDKPVTDMPEIASGCIILDGVQDPGNVGTMIRTANAMNVPLAVMTGNSADPFNPKSVRASMGAVFRQRIAVADPLEIESLKTRCGFTVYAADLSEGARDIRSADLKGAAVVIGSEGRGAGEEMLRLCDGRIYIPIDGRTDSLNAAAAAAIIMWEMNRGNQI